MRRSRILPVRGLVPRGFRIQDATLRRARTRAAQSTLRLCPGIPQETVAGDGRTSVPLLGTRSSPVATETKFSRPLALPDLEQFPARLSFERGRPAQVAEHGKHKSINIVGNDNFNALKRCDSMKPTCHHTARVQQYL